MLARIFLRLIRRKPRPREWKPCERTIHQLRTVLFDIDDFICSQEREPLPRPICDNIHIICSQEREPLPRPICDNIHKVLIETGGFKCR